MSRITLSPQATLGGSNVFTGTNTFRETVTEASLTNTLGEGKIVIDQRNVPQWTAATQYRVGDIVQNTSEPVVFDYGLTTHTCYVQGYLQVQSISGTGTSHATVEPTWPGIGATVTDNAGANQIVWVGISSARRVFEIWDSTSAGRGALGGPSTFFTHAGNLRSVRNITLGGTTNGLTGENWDLWDPFVAGSGTSGGIWYGAVVDGNDQPGFGYNSRSDAGFTGGYPFIYGTGNPLSPPNKTIFAIGQDGGLYFTGTSGGHSYTIGIPDSDTGYEMALRPSTTNKQVLVYNGLVSAAVGGKLSNNPNSVGNVGAAGAGTEDNLKTYTLPANALNVNNKGLKIKCWGTTASTAASKTVDIMFGTASILSKQLEVSVSGFWSFEMYVTRTGASTQDIYCEATNSHGTTVSGTDGPTVAFRSTFTTGTETDTSTIVIKCRATVATNTNDIVQEGLLVEYLN